MEFLEKHFGQDYSTASIQEIEALKAENEARAIKAEEVNQVFVDHMPTWLNMTNTTRCNLQCIMCNQAYGKIEEMAMEPGIYEKIVKEFYPFLKTVQLTAIGEPMMTPKLLAKIDDMLRYGVKLEMVTNGTLMKGDKLLKRLAAASELITVSLDGATKDTFNAIRVGADFEAVIENIRRFNAFRFALPAEERGELNFNYILMKRNIHELPDFVDLAADLDARRIICSHLVLYDEGLAQEMLSLWPGLCNRYTAEAARRAAERQVEIILPPTFTMDAPPGASDGKRTREQAPGENPSFARESPTPLGPEEEYTGEKCYFLWRRVYIGPHGEVVPCCLSGVESMGNMKNHPFPEIWNNKRYTTLRKYVHTRNPPSICQGCYLINRNPQKAEFKRL
jgi:radical SAM protein with 4Fe4S-binding SPASM domain